MLIALNLYFQLPFGKQHSKFPKIIELADKMGRTPGSLAMKLNNFTSLDPLEQARGIAGLSGATKKDQLIWNEFAENRNDLAVESEEYLERLIGEEVAELDVRVPDDPVTEKLMPQKIRLQQRYFRRVVLASYGARCCVSGLPLPSLLRASHIVPWAESEEHRLDPSNGLCLAATYDAAFDRGLISFDDELKMLVSDQISQNRGDEEVKRVFISHEGNGLLLPAKNFPSLEFLSSHRKRWGFS
jgi:putative restriction endonuclease